MMPLFVQDIEQLSKEMRSFKKGKLPPMISFLITACIAVISFLVSAFYIFPFLMRVFQMRTLSAGLIALGVFVILNVFIGELTAVYLEFKKQTARDQ